VFDRGGYSKEFCVAVAERILFVCWRSDARKVPDIPRGSWIDVEVEQSANTVEEVVLKQLQAWERTRTIEAEGGKAELRELWIKSGEKVSPALSNDFSRPLAELASLLVGRWAAQENRFKELKAHGIDRIHSYRAECYSEEHLYRRGLEDPAEGVRHEIANPKVRAINKELTRLRAEQEKLTAKLQAAEKNGAKAEQLRALRRKLAGIRRTIHLRIAKRDGLPAQVRQLDRIEEEQILRLCDGKKMFFDWLKMNAIWAKKMLVDVAKPFYHDLRDVNRFVTSVLQARTYVRRHGRTLEVAFPPQRSKPAENALEAMCRYLNETGSFNMGLTFTKITFRVGTKH
jgi:hypothetical protein